MFSLEKFQNDGYVVVEDFLSPAEVDEMKADCFQLVEDTNVDDINISIFTTTENPPNLRDDYFLSSSDKVRCFFEEQSIDESGKLKVDKQLALNKIGHALHVFGPQSFQKITFGDKVKAIFQQLGFLDPVVVQTMYIFKQPHIGGIVTAHQDATYLYTEPMRVVGLWMALDDADADNGCLTFLPGSHKAGLHGDYRMVKNGNKGTYEGSKPAYDSDKFVPVLVKKGSLILIDGLVVHESQSNSSERPRHAFTIHVYDAKNSKWSDRNWLQPTSTNTFTSMFDRNIE